MVPESQRSSLSVKKPFSTFLEAQLEVLKGVLVAPFRFDRQSGNFLQAFHVLYYPIDRAAISGAWLVVPQIIFKVRDKT